jgi:holo-[acyl-carrier protein] synthase
MENKLAKTIIDLRISQHIAVGNDLVFVPEFALSLNPAFKQKVYTPNEIAYCDRFTNPLLRYASTWAGKEAVYKAVKQLDETATGFKKIELIRTKIGGRPQVTLHNHPGKFKISLSISHDGDYVWAVALVEYI